PGEYAADREPGVTGTDHDRRDVFDGDPPVADAAVPLDDLDGDVGRIGHDVVYGRAFLRLCDECLDVFLRCVGVDVKRDLDVVVAVAHVAVDAEDAVEVHLALELRLHRAQLY